MTTNQIQMGKLTSHVTVIDEDQLLTPQQLDKITDLVMAKVEQKLMLQQQRAHDQAIDRDAPGMQEWLR